MLLLAAPGCRPKQAVEPEAPVVATAAPEARRVADGAATIVAKASSPVQLLPDTTVGVMNVAGARALLAVVDVEALIAKYRAYYDQAASFVTTNVGFNLLDPGQWREIGVDPDGPMGAAILDVQSESFAGFITLSDPAKFRAFLDKIAGESNRLSPVIEDRGTVLKANPDSTSAVVLRDGFAFVVSTDRPNAAPYDFARLLATIDPARGLTASPRYQRALAGGEPGRPLTGYLDLWTIYAASQAAREARDAESGPSWAEQELERATASGAPPEELARLRVQVDNDRGWKQQYAERRAREAQMVTRWLGQVEPLVFEFKGDLSGVVGKIRAKMPETHPLRAALRNAPTPSPVLLALGERPLVVLGGSVEVPAALASFEELVRADGEDPEKLYAQLRDLLQVDIKADLLPVLTGAGGFALTVSEALMRGETGRGDAKQIGFAAAVAVNDPARAQALVERLVQRVPVKLGKDRKTGAYALEVPEYRAVYVAVVAGQLAVTTDVGVIQRLAAGTTTSTSKWLDAGVVPLLTARDAAMQGLFNLILPSFLLFRSSSSDWGMSPPLQPYGLFPDAGPEKIDRVPQSRAYKAKLREWEGINAKIRKEEQVRERAQVAGVIKLAESVGVMAGDLREQSDGLVLEGGQIFGKGGLTRAIETGVEAFAGVGEKRSYELYSARSQLEEELRRIRVTDVATALKVPRPMM